MAGHRDPRAGEARRDPATGPRPRRGRCRPSTSGGRKSSVTPRCSRSSRPGAAGVLVEQSGPRRERVLATASRTQGRRHELGEVEPAQPAQVETVGLQVEQLGDGDLGAERAGRCVRRTPPACRRGAAPPLAPPRGSNQAKPGATAAPRSSTRNPVSPIPEIARASHRCVAQRPVARSCTATAVEESTQGRGQGPRRPGPSCRRVRRATASDAGAPAPARRARRRPAASARCCRGRGRPPVVRSCRHQAVRTLRSRSSYVTDDIRVHGTAAPRAGRVRSAPVGRPAAPLATTDRDAAGLALRQ